MIGREAYRNPWIFAQDILTHEEKIDLVLKYINKVNSFLNNKYLEKKSLSHLQNIFNSNTGAKNWRKAVNFSSHNNDLQYLLNYIKSF